MMSKTCPGLHSPHIILIYSIMKHHLHIALCVVFSLAATLTRGGDDRPENYLTGDEYQYFEEDWVLGESELERLASAKVIVAGRVLSVRYVSRDADGGVTDSLPPNYAEILKGYPIDIYEAVVAVDRTIAGEFAGKQIRIEILREPSGDPNFSFLQPVKVGKRFVFFLSEEDGEVWKGIGPTRFAIRTEAALSVDSIGDLQTGNALRQIAIANIRNSDELCAAIWFEILRPRYDSEKDYKLSVQMAEDPRPLIRGQALALLSEHHRETDGLYRKAYDYVMQEPSSSRQQFFKMSIGSSLIPIMQAQEPKRVDTTLKEWLSHDKKFLRDAALNAIRKGKRDQLANDVLEYLDRTKDRSEKYRCYKTLCALHGARLTSIASFEKDPESYVNQFRK